MRSFVCSRAFIVRSFVCSFMRAYMFAFVRSCVCSFNVHSRVRLSLVCWFVRSLIPGLVRLLVHDFVLSFCSFNYGLFVR